MKRLVSLSVVMLFAVVGMAGMAHAQQFIAKVTLVGRVQIRDFDYGCAYAEVSNSDSHFSPATPIRTDANGMYMWQMVTVPALVTTEGTLAAKWPLDLFGVRLLFEGSEHFAFVNPFPFGTPTQVVNIGVIPTQVQ
jgi:hypothetical protein